MAQKSINLHKLILLFILATSKVSKKHCSQCDSHFFSFLITLDVNCTSVELYLCVLARWHQMKWTFHAHEHFICGDVWNWRENWQLLKVNKSANVFFANRIVKTGVLCAKKRLILMLRRLGKVFVWKFYEFFGGEIFCLKEIFRGLEGFCKVQAFKKVFGKFFW